MKTCSKCKEQKPPSSYYRHKRTRDGLQSRCKLCCAKSTKQSKLTKKCPDCNMPIYYTAERCTPCSKTGERHPRWRGGRRVAEDGYVYLRIDGKTVSEHRHVMTEHLGRPLLSEESVHHKNGDRTDNRIENLELWSKAQPSGQRIEDKVTWAKQILALYEPEALA